FLRRPNLDVVWRLDAKLCSLAQDRLVDGESGAGDAVRRAAHVEARIRFALGPPVGHNAPRALRNRANLSCSPLSGYSQPRPPRTRNAETIRASPFSLQTPSAHRACFAACSTWA